MRIKITFANPAMDFVLYPVESLRFGRQGTKQGIFTKTFGNNEVFHPNATPQIMMVEYEQDKIPA